MMLSRSQHWQLIKHSNSILFFPFSVLTVSSQSKRIQRKFHENTFERRKWCRRGSEKLWAASRAMAEGRPSCPSSHCVAIPWPINQIDRSIDRCPINRLKNQDKGLIDTCQERDEYVRVC